MFSIIIPLYNKSEFICRAIDSVLIQNFKKFEIIVVNDGSTDGGELLVKEKYGSDLVLIHQTNQGVSITRNRGISVAKYPYIAFLDADDVWDSNYLFSVNEAITKGGFPGIIGTNYIRFTSFENIKELKTQNSSQGLAKGPNFYSIKDFFDQAILNTLMFTSSVVLKKEFFDNNPGFDPPIKFGEDLDVWFRAILFYSGIAFVPSKLVYYSREDESGATKRIYNLSNTLIPKIIGNNYFNWLIIKDEADKNAFERFKIKWIYLRIFPNYTLDENRQHIELLIPRLKKKLILIGWLYLLPFTMLKKLFSNRRASRYWLKYLNFFFKNIYS